MHACRRMLGVAALMSSALLLGRTAGAQSAAPSASRRPSHVASVAVPVGATLVVSGAVLGLGGLLVTGIAFAHSAGCWEHCWSLAVPYTTITIGLLGATTLLAGSTVLIAGLVARHDGAHVTARAIDRFAMAPWVLDRGAGLVAGVRF